MSLECDVALRTPDFALSVAFEAPAGTTVAVVGPPGSGKTTLLRALAGLEPATGSITLDGRRIDGAPPEQRGIGVVFQERLLFPNLSIMENIAYPLRARGVGGRLARRRADVMLGRLGAAAIGRTAPSRLSGGEAVRVALARALAAEPKALLVDEPFAGVEETTRPGVRTAVAAELASFEGPRIVATRDPVEALVLGDRIVVLEHGHVSQIGTAAELRQRPATQYVATVAGLSVVRGTVRREAGDRVMLITSGDPIAVETGYSGEAYAVVRGAAVSLFPFPPNGSPSNVFRRSVVAIAIEGGRALVSLDGDPPLVAEITAASARRLLLEPESGVYAVFKATDVAILPAS